MTLYCQQAGIAAQEVISTTENGRLDKPRAHHRSDEFNLDQLTEVSEVGAASST